MVSGCRAVLACFASIMYYFCGVNLRRFPGWLFTFECVQNTMSHWMTGAWPALGISVTFPWCGRDWQCPGHLPVIRTWFRQPARFTLCFNGHLSLNSSVLWGLRDIMTIDV